MKSAEFKSIMPQPLVSVALITYNSAAFVMETLESIRLQLYTDIELIISDDGSMDETIALCKAWLIEHEDRFVRSEIITVEKNTGIPANCNRAVNAAEGQWLKIIAGDDILDEACISLNVDFCRQAEFKDMIVISDMIQFRDGEDPRTGVRVPPPDIYLLDGAVDSELQQRYLLRSHFGNSPSLFISMNILQKVPFDESIPFMEDWPFAINATKAGFYFHYLHAATVYYRISNSSVYASKSSNVLFNDFYIKKRPFLFKYIYPNISKWERAAMEIEFKRMKTLDALGLNKNNILCKIINAVTHRLAPYYFFKKVINRDVPVHH